jgi:hypothetical protein
MNWLLFATKVPLVVTAIMQTVQAISQAGTGAKKKEAVLAAVPESVQLAEFAIGRDLLNDDAVRDLLSAYIDAEKAAMKAKAALQAGILAKQPAE